MAKRRQLGSGTLRKRTDGRWEGRIVIGYNEKSLPITKNVLAKTKAECEEKLQKLKAEINAPVTIDIDSNVSFGTWIDYWYNTYIKATIKPSTRVGYENNIYNHIIPSIGNIQLSSLTSSDLQEFYNSLKEDGRIILTSAHGKGLSDRAIQSCHITCKSALARAISDGLIKKNPAEFCKVKSQKRAEMKVLSPDEIQRFLIQAKYDGYFEIFLMDLMTGLRRGELLGVKWKDINFRTGELHIKRQVQLQDGKMKEVPPKTNFAKRTIILPPTLIDVLKEYKNTCQSEWLFPSPTDNSRPRNAHTLYRQMQRVLEKAECKKVRMHDLRHTFATMSLKSGMDVKTLSAIIGHASAGTTLNIYAHTTEEMQKNAAMKIEKSLGQNLDSSKQNRDVTNKATEKPTQSDFEPKKGKRRKAGTGCIHQINDNLWEGSYSPKINGKKVKHNIYAHSEEECERELKKLIEKVKKG